MTQESLAHTFLRLNQHSRMSDKKVLPGMRQIQDINIYNRLMHAYAKRVRRGSSSVTRLMHAFAERVRRGSSFVTRLMHAYAKRGTRVSSFVTRLNIHSYAKGVRRG